MSDLLPDLYVKTGCPWCREAIDFFEKNNIPHQIVNVSESADAMRKMVELSGQSKAPTLDWNDDILADFGTDELIPFLRQRGVIA